MAVAPDLTSRIGDIARRLLGEPNRAMSTRASVRFGGHGSIAVEIGGSKRGQWFDHENEIGGGPRELIRLKGGIADDEGVDAWLERELGIVPRPREATPSRRRIVARYDYRDERGRLAYQVVRCEPREFRQRRPDGKGGWIWSLKGIERLPYRLPELLAASSAALVFIPEGEKDVDRLAALGLAATCNSEGAGKWRPHFARWFAGRDVVVLPDNDEPGRRHAATVAANVAPVARTVRVLDLPGLAAKGDVSDWIAAGGMRGQLEAMAAAAPIYRSGPVDASPGGLRLIGFDEMKPRLADGYLIKGLLPSGSMAVVFGDSGTGKTFFTLHLALCIAGGSECFGRRVRRAGVVYVAAEAGRSVENRVAAAKHEIEFPATMPFAAVTAPLDLCTDPTDVERLVAAIRAVDLGCEVELVVIDTLSRTMGAGNENDPADMGSFVRSVDAMRVKLGAAVLVVHHSGKDIARGARGHSLLRAATDTEIEITRDGESRTALVTKQRDGATEGEIRFALQVVELGIDSDGDPVTSCVIEELPEAAHSARPQRRLSPQQQRAFDMLRRAIDEAGEVPPASNHIPAGYRTVTEGIWRDYCHRGGISGGEQRAQRQAFQRAAEALVAAGRVGKWEPYVWLV